MDSLTHILGAALWTEPVCMSTNVPSERWRERLSVCLAALLPDADGIIGLIDPNLYTRYHRVVTHSVVGLILCALTAAALSAVWPKRWMLPSVIGRSMDSMASIPIPMKRLMQVAFIAVGVHFLCDWITAWAVRPFWPFWSIDVSLYRVNSLEPRLLLLTVLAFGLQRMAIQRGRRRLAWAMAIAWLGLAALYVWLRPLYGPPAFV